MRIIFMGTPEFAKESLEKLYEAKHEIIAVITNPDKPQGRKMELKASVVKEYALSKDIQVLQPETLRNPEIIEKIKELNPDLICVVVYGKFLPKEILDIPKYRLHKCSSIIITKI